MTDTRPYDELPWLRPVEDEDQPRGLSARKMLAALLLVMLAAAMVAGTFFWLGRRDSVVTGPPELIQAPPGPYKVKPPNPGGLDISSESETAFETSAGEDKDSQLDTSKLAQAPAVKTAEDKTKTERPAATPPAAAAADDDTTTKPMGGQGSVVQLGAFANKAQAERAWTALSARFASVASMNKMIVPFPGGIRLRAGASSPANAKAVCDTLKAAGENCFVAQ
ncbi:MAG TPA: SPOR domain-containing protein [Sphingomicrobium sp.]|nr:SPOR domain-containing protein [Sphingomicrobium sp.]